MGIREELAEAYEELPKMKKSKCYDLCLKGKCDFECCTITGCSAKERKNINNYIKENGLKLPMVWEKILRGYLLPHGNKENPKCEYIGPEGCLIYEVRPAICRLFGAVKQMPCEFQKRKASHADYPLKTMVKVGMMSEEQYQLGEENGGLELFDALLGRKKQSIFKKIIAKFL
jgi:Fe-S-cluster containining protein